ncbi:MAG: DUF309 domain-containing protein [Phormidesmis sp.]
MPIPAKSSVEILTASLISMSTPDYLPEQLKTGVCEFNQGDFYACHDTLEAAWMEAENAEKPFYQGILQIAVAFYHLGNLNWRGGAILLGEGISRLRKFEPSHQGIAVEALVDDSVEWLGLVQAAGPDGLAEIMSDLPRSLPQITWASASLSPSATETGPRTD